MSCASSVEDVLRALSAEHSDILGAALSTPRRLYLDFPGELAKVDAGSVIDYAATMFAVSGTLGQSAPPFNQLYLDYGRISLHAMQMEQTLLVVVLRPAGRSRLEAVQELVRRFLEPLQKALFAAEGSDRPALVRPVRALRPSGDPQS